MSEKSPVVGRNRPANNPGGMQCERCGEIFIGEEWHTLCGICIQRTADEIAEAQQLDTRPPSQPGRDEVAVRLESARLAEKLSRIVLQMQRTGDWRLSEPEADTITDAAKWLLAVSSRNSTDE